MIWTKQTTGYGKQVNEDIIHIDENEKILFVGVADGQSNKQFATEGARLALVRASQYLKKQNLENLKQLYEDELQCEIIKPIREGLHYLARLKGVDVTEFSSTLCAIAIDKKTGEFVILNLGDGLILGLTKQRKIRILLDRERGLQKESTYLTTTRNAAWYMRLGWGKIDEYMLFVLVTDGIRILHGGCIEKRVAQMLISENYDEIEKEIEERTRRDDCTVLIVKPD